MFKRQALVSSACVLLMFVTPVAARAQEAANDELLVDPTTPLNFVIPTGGNDEPGALAMLGSMFTSYELSSVLIRAEDRIAVINGERVRIGDSIGAARVTAIEADHVTLNVNGKIETLQRYENSIKTLVKGDE